MPLRSPPLPLRWHYENASNWGRNVSPAPATYNSYSSKLSAPVVNPFAQISVSGVGLEAQRNDIAYSGGTNPLQPVVRGPRIS